MRIAPTLLLLVACPTSAFALDQGVHRSISHDACVSAGLPEAFCARVGTEAYNVDSYEWSDPAAHAQLPDGANDTCTGANATLDRERWLGDDLRKSLDQVASQGASNDLVVHIATYLGRALHTVQDDCAHHGMPNMQHAWWSLLDTCTGSKTSPDVQPEAASCARSETDAVFYTFVGQMYAKGVTYGDLDGIDKDYAHWPARGDVCAFLKSASAWSGDDARWENSEMVPMLRDQLTHALTVDGNSIANACDPQFQLSSYNPDAPVDVSNPPSMCLKIKLFCIGKVDAPDAPPPWESDTTTTTDAQAAGCSATSTGSPVFLAAVVGVALVTRRRRR